MFNKEKKYTMDEFEEMFINAQRKTLIDLENSHKTKNDESDGMTSMFINMMNMIALSTLHNNLFGEEKEEE